MNLTAFPKRLALLLLLLAVGLVATSLALQLTVGGSTSPNVQKLTAIFYVDSEGNLPSWFSASLLFGAGLLFLVIGFCRRYRQDSAALQWLLMGLLFVALSSDEAVSFHEKLISPLRSLLNAEGLLYFTWIVPGVVVLAGLALYFAPFVRHLPGRVRAGFLLALAIFLAGALGLEALGGAVYETAGSGGLLYQMLTHTEEFLEMAGVIVLVTVLLEDALHYLPVEPARPRGAAPAVK